MKFVRRLWYSLRHRGIDAELAEELESHRAMAQARLEQRRALRPMPPRRAGA